MSQLPYRSAPTPSRTMTRAQMLLLGWVLTCAACGVVVVIAALRGAYSPMAQTYDVAWILLMALWLPVTLACGMLALGWYCVYTCQASASKNVMLDMRVMLECWRYGYTLLGVAGTIGVFGGVEGLLVLSLVLLVVWGVLHGGLWWTRHLLSEAARCPNALPDNRPPVASPEQVARPAAPYQARVQRYLRMLRERRTSQP